jgi:hypothetical protein
MPTKWEDKAMEASFEIVAISPAEGRAIVREPKGLFAVQAPFRSGDRYPVSERTLDRALASLDFQSVSIHCAGLAQVCDEVNLASSLHWKEERSSADVATQILKHAEVWIVTDYLNSLLSSVGSIDRAVLLDAALEAFAFDAVADDSVRELIRAIVEKTKPTSRSLEIDPEEVAPRATRKYEHKKLVSIVAKYRRDLMMVA